MFLSIVAIGIIVYFLLRRDNHGINLGKMEVKDDPLRIAKERYARGELSTDEYREIKDNL